MDLKQVVPVDQVPTMSIGFDQNLIDGFDEIKLENGIAYYVRKGLTKPKHKIFRHEGTLYIINGGKPYRISK